MVRVCHLVSTNATAVAHAIICFVFEVQRVNMVR
jgi:hypothetical protein